jgi:hypothetical protein
MTELHPIEPDASVDREALANVQPGQTVRRMLAGTIPVDLKVAAVDDEFIYCGPVPVPGAPPNEYPGWKFDRTYGYEIDEDLVWGVKGPDGILTGSYLVGVVVAES